MLVFMAAFMIITQTFTELSLPSGLNHDSDGLHHDLDGLDNMIMTMTFTI